MMIASVLRSIASGNPCTKVSIKGFCMAPQVSREVLEDEGLERLLAVVVYLVRGKGYTGVRLLMSVGCVGCECIFNALEFGGLFYYRMGNAFLLVRPSLFPIFLASQMN